ncbi:hypothetical protein [Saliniramus sp.]|uniref:hypothetical protein n=1 Tax=Saliniramus sp. TaxID=2986772 RepID=UPI002CE93E06|nr:hypothetical protein [Saliniramus sp.]HMB11808.1 hypothetical protein [Saliniramus sp.]
MRERNLEELAKIAGKYAITGEIGVREMGKKDIFVQFHDFQKKGRNICGPSQGRKRTHKGAIQRRRPESHSKM